MFETGSRLDRYGAPFALRILAVQGTLKIGPKAGVRTSPPVWSVLPWRALVCCAAAARIVGGGAAACIAWGGAAVRHRRGRRCCSVAATSPGGCCSPRCWSPRGLGLPTRSLVRAAPQIAGGRGLVNPAARARCATDRRWLLLRACCCCFATAALRDAPGHALAGPVTGALHRMCT
jgi:hypothetical protein